MRDELLNAKVQSGKEARVFDPGETDMSRPYTNLCVLRGFVVNLFLFVSTFTTAARSRISLLFLLSAIVLVSCKPLIPATTPPQLEYTPGAFISLDDNHVETAQFSVSYPDGWRVIKLSVASDPITLTFAAPDDTMVITISESPLPEQEIPAGHIQRIDSLENNGITLYLQGTSPRSESERFNVFYDNVFASVLFKDAG